MGKEGFEPSPLNFSKAIPRLISPDSTPSCFRALPISYFPSEYDKWAGLELNQHLLTNQKQKTAVSITSFAARRSYRNELPARWLPAKILTWTLVAFGPLPLKVGLPDKLDLTKLDVYRLGRIISSNLNVDTSTFKTRPGEGI